MGYPSSATSARVLRPRGRLAAALGRCVGTATSQFSVGRSTAPREALDSRERDGSQSKSHGEGDEKPLH
jgi:hypothetical protein